MQLYNLTTRLQSVQRQPPGNLWSSYALFIFVACCCIGILVKLLKRREPRSIRSLQAENSLLPTTSKDLNRNLGQSDTVTKGNDKTYNAYLRYHHLGWQPVGGETMAPEKKSPSTKMTGGVARPDDDNTNQVRPRDGSNANNTETNADMAETQPEAEETQTQAKKSPFSEPREPMPVEEEEPPWRRHSYPRDQTIPGPLRKDSTHHEMEHVPDEFHAGIIWRRRTIVFEGKA
ncbi:hypothetical protein LTS17_001349 [Exophiala oligosperma]